MEVLIINRSVSDDNIIGLYATEQAKFLSKAYTVLIYDDTGKDKRRSSIGPDRLDYFEGRADYVIFYYYSGIWKDGEKILERLHGGKYIFVCETDTREEDFMQFMQKFREETIIVESEMQRLELERMGVRKVEILPAMLLSDPNKYIGEAYNRTVSYVSSMKGHFLLTAEESLNTVDIDFILDVADCYRVNEYGPLRWELINCGFRRSRSLNDYIRSRIFDRQLEKNVVIIEGCSRKEIIIKQISASYYMHVSPNRTVTTGAAVSAFLGVPVISRNRTTEMANNCFFCPTGNKAEYATAVKYLSESRDKYLWLVEYECDRYQKLYAPELMRDRLQMILKHGRKDLEGKTE